MQILIFGNGWVTDLFTSMLNNFYNNDKYIISSTRVKFASVAKIDEELELLKPTHVLCTVSRTIGDGQTTVEYLESDDKLFENLQSNLFAPITLSNLCAKHRIHFTYIGSGHIFENTDIRSDFTETDFPNFVRSKYSCVKSFTDQLMQTQPNTLNARIRMAIDDTPHPRNFITKHTHSDTDSQTSITMMPEILHYIHDMMKHRVTGTYNMVNPGTISRNRISELYTELVGEVEVTSEKSPYDVDATLNVYKLSMLYPNITNAEEAVRYTLESYALKTANV